MDEELLPQEPAPAAKKPKIDVSVLAAGLSETTKRAEETEKAVAGLSDKLSSVLALLEGMTAKDRGAGSTPRVEVAAFEENTYGTATFAEGRDGVQLIKPVNGDLESPEMKKKMEIEAFNAEMLLIETLNDNNLESDTVFEIAVNGRPFLFARNQEYTVPRYVVEGLMRSRPVSYRNEEFMDKRTNTFGYRYPATRGLRYPFNIKHDPSGTRPGTKGGDWYVRVMREP